MRPNNSSKRFFVLFAFNKMRFTSISLSIILSMLLLLSLMEACTSSVRLNNGGLNDSTTKPETSNGVINPEFTPNQSTVQKQNECPGLDSQLFQLTQANDPQQLAEQLGLKVKDGAVQVLIILNNEDTGFLKDYGVVVGTQSGNQVQAYVLIERLCELVNNESVIAIRLAAQVNP